MHSKEGWNKFGGGFCQIVGMMIENMKAEAMRAMSVRGLACFSGDVCSL
jgi:hypothetical protein